jgi:hypothetical protein
MSGRELTAAFALVAAAHVPINLVSYAVGRP